MKKMSNILRKLILKHGDIIACCAFAFVTFTSNSSSMLIFFEPKEPSGIEKFKKYSSKKNDDVHAYHK